MGISWLRVIGILGAAAGALALPACNGSDDTSGSSSTTNESATGVWTGTDSVSGLAITALINAAGQATFIRADGVQFDGDAEVSGDTLAVTVTGYANYPGTFTDGSTYGLGTVNGTVTTGSSISATLSFTTNANTALTGTWSLTYETISDNSSSTTAVSGNYTDAVTGAVLSVTSAGAMTEQNSNSQSTYTSCVLNGSIATADSTHDIYEVSYEFEDCTGIYATLNGVQFTGLASLNTSVSPAQLTVAVAGTSSSSKYAVVSTLNGS
jgi:hypothetical protein